MLRRRANDRGLAEIVGTLMLVLTVVSAAVAFSLFVASYQQQLQASEAATHATALEALHVLAVDTTPNATGSPTFASMSVTVSSGDIDPMWVEALLVDGVPVVNYNATYLASATTVGVGVLAGDTNTTLFLPALQQVAITLHLNPLASNFSFLAGEPIPKSNTSLSLDFFTSRGNSFTTVYLPPTALADVTYIQSTTKNGTIVEDPVLDGTHSFQEGTNATIVAWDWNITNSTPGWYKDVSGAEVEPSGLVSGDNYSAVLTVRNSVGLLTVSLPVTFQAA